jgi:YfiR/HmsC-like
VSILTVGESKEFLQQGGMIGFVLRDQRVQFAVNNKAANAAGLHISARLLGVATAVTE